MKKISVLILLAIVALGMAYPVKHTPTKYYYFCSTKPTKWNVSEKKMVAYTDIKEVMMEDTRDLTLARQWSKLVNMESIGFGGDSSRPANQWEIPYTADVNFYLTPEEAQIQVSNFLKAFPAEKYTVKKLELK